MKEYPGGAELGRRGQRPVDVAQRDHQGGHGRLQVADLAEELARVRLGLHPSAHGVLADQPVGLRGHGPHQVGDADEAAGLPLHVEGVALVRELHRDRLQHGLQPVVVGAVRADRHRLDLGVGQVLEAADAGAGTVEHFVVVPQPDGAVLAELDVELGAVEDGRAVDHRLERVLVEAGLVAGAAVHEHAGGDGLHRVVRQGLELGAGRREQQPEPRQERPRPHQLVNRYLSSTHALTFHRWGSEKVTSELPVGGQGGGPGDPQVQADRELRGDGPHRGGAGHQREQLPVVVRVRLGPVERLGLPAELDLPERPADGVGVAEPRAPVRLPVGPRLEPISAPSVERSPRCSSAPTWSSS